MSEGEGKGGGPPAMRIHGLLRHNPYVGVFHRFGPLNGFSFNVQLPRASPHVGNFRHSPCSPLIASAAVSPPVSRGQGLRDLLFEEDPTVFMSQLHIARRNRDMGYSRLGSLNSSLNKPSSSIQASSEISEADNSDQLCQVCFNPLRQLPGGEGDTEQLELKRLECSHVFHKTCIDVWVRGLSSFSHVSAPASCLVCRTQRSMSNRSHSSDLCYVEIIDYFGAAQRKKWTSGRGSSEGGESTVGYYYDSSSFT